MVVILDIYHSCEDHGSTFEGIFGAQLLAAWSPDRIWKPSNKKKIVKHKTFDLKDDLAHINFLLVTLAAQHKLISLEFNPSIWSTAVVLFW